MKLIIHRTTGFYRILNNRTIPIKITPGTYSVKEVLTFSDGILQWLVIFTKLSEIKPRLRGKVMATKKFVKRQASALKLIP